MSVYLDYNASAPIDPRVLDVMINCYQEFYGNADSRTHYFGENAKKQVEDARSKIAKLLNAKSNEVFFTSGSTESNNIAVLGLRKYGIDQNKKHIITSSIEHKAIIQSTKELMNDGFEVEYVDPGEDGRVSAEEILSKVRPDTLLVSLMHSNNETGMIQPVKEVGQKLNEIGVLFHIDATQSCGKLVEEIQNLDYDMMSISAHKMAGPQGVGALVLRRKRYKLPPVSPIMFGGPQEHGIRPGTLPTALIVGFGATAEICLNEYQENYQKNIDIKNELMSLIEQSGVQYCINGDQKYAVPNTLNISFLGVDSEALMISTRQYCGISNGSACNSNSYNHSYVLKAMGLSDERIESAVRISWGPNTNLEILKTSFSGLLKIAKSFS